MSRCAREKCGNSIYHICVRGNNRQDIFLDDQDREEYLTRLEHYKEKYKMHVYAYCLMTNHVHLLIYDNDEDISKFMQGLNLSYVIYFNHRHNRVGHLFQNRFTSVVIKDNAQLLCTSKYIHLNPVKAGIVKDAREYRWSSFKAYTQEDKDLKIVDTQFLGEMSSHNVVSGKKAYVQYVMEEDDIEEREEIASTVEKIETQVKDLKGIKRLDYQEAYKVLKDKWKKEENNIKDIKKYFNEQDIWLYLLGLISRLSWVQIARNLNVSEFTIYKRIRSVVGQMIMNKRACRKVDEIIFSL